MYDLEQMADRMIANVWNNLDRYVIDGCKVSCTIFISAQQCCVDQETEQGIEGSE